MFQIFAVESEQPAITNGSPPLSGTYIAIASTCARLPSNFVTNLESEISAVLSRSFEKKNLKLKLRIFLNYIPLLKILLNFSDSSNEAEVTGYTLSYFEETVLFIIFCSIF
jgi:hypothetical protein